uniref:Uncharacterized protein n=1 Tax=Globodera rostochiensis TaxID=31243 RepID=A0A914H1B4_GLORO
MFVAHPFLRLKHLRCRPPLSSVGCLCFFSLCLEGMCRVSWTSGHYRHFMPKMLTFAGCVGVRSVEVRKGSEAAESRRDNYVYPCKRPPPKSVFELQQTDTTAGNLLTNAVVMPTFHEWEQLLHKTAALIKSSLNVYLPVLTNLDHSLLQPIFPQVSNSITMAFLETI